MGYETFSIRQLQSFYERTERPIECDADWQAVMILDKETE